MHFNVSLYPVISTYDYQLADLILDHSTEVLIKDHVMVQLIGLNGINLSEHLLKGCESEHIPIQS